MIHPHRLVFICFGVALVAAFGVADTINATPKLSRMLPPCYKAPMVMLCH